MSKFIATLFVFSFASHALAASPPNYSILQGATSDSVTHFTITARRADTLTFTAVRGGETRVPSKIERVEFPGSDWTVYRLKFEGLDLNGQYTLDVRKNGEPIDERYFQMLDPKRAAGRIAITSCMFRQFHNPFMWSQLQKPENRPELLLILGDVVYLDRANLFWSANPTSELEVWEQFALSRNQLGLYRWKNLVPTLSVWDDHDSGGNNVDYKFGLMAAIRPIYETYMANDEIKGVVDHGPALAKTFRLFNKNFIMLDGRSFREADPASPMLGALQEQWMLEQIQPGANFLLNGIQFFGRHLGKDSLEYNWPEYHTELARKLSEASAAKDARLAFLSGDIHFSEVQTIEAEALGYETVEITSSSAHSMTFPGRHIFLNPFNPRQIRVTSTHNVVVMDFAATDKPFDFSVRALGWRGNTLFENEVAITFDECARKVVTNVK